MNPIPLHGPGGESSPSEIGSMLPGDPAPGAAGTPAERIAALERALDEARAQARHERDLLATMSHELRTPMNGVMGMAHLLLESELDRDQRGMVEVIRHSCQALLSLVNDTLDFARIESGRVELERIDFDLRVTVSEIAALLAPLANEKQLPIEFRVAHDVPSRLTGDPGRIRQVLLNLTGNAIKFTDDGRVGIAVERTAEDDTHVTLRFQVSDTGIGLADDHRTRLFEAFEQADASIARRFGGTGLGLSVSRRLVELMGGAIGVDSAAGQGSTFWFTLPLLKQPEAAMRPAADGVLAGVRVLVADPSRASRASLAERLASWECVAVEAESAAEALERLHDAARAGEPCRIALIDRFVDGGGEALGAAVRADAALADTHTVLMATIGRRGDGAEARAKGFSGYLTKPLEWDTLAEALAEVLRQVATPEKPAELVTRHTVAEARRGRVRILLVEDNAVNQLVTKWALQRLGYSMDTADCGARALEACATEGYALVISDIHMPDMDGYAFTRELHTRQDARGEARSPVVALTGNTEPGERERCIDAGMCEFLTKPVDLARLCEIVQRFTADDTTAAPPVVASAPPVATSAPPVTMAAPGPAAAAPDPAAAPEHPAVATDTTADSDASGTAAAAALTDDCPLDLARLAEMSMGVPSLRDTLLDTFLNEVHPRIDTLRASIARADATACEFEAHGLKGMCATVGALRCSALFGEIEHAAHDGVLANADHVLDRAIVSVEQAERYITGTDRELLAA